MNPILQASAVVVVGTLTVASIMMGIILVSERLRGESTSTAGSTVHKPNETADVKP